MLESSGGSSWKNAKTVAFNPLVACVNTRVCERFFSRRFNFFPAQKVFLISAVLIFSLFAVPRSSFANNLSVSNVTIASRSASADTATVQFDISWSNSWRNQANWDAAWVFLKYSVDGGTTWAHATLKTAGTDPSGFSTGSGTSITTVVPTDKLGGFIYRSAIGSGSLSTTSVKFVWDYAANGVSDTASVTLKVFGVEMVYISTGSFYAGDAGSSYALNQGSSDTDPWVVSSEDAISVTNPSSNGFRYVSASNSGEDATGASFTIAASFPKGYTAFYLMKYEITEGQWVDFFNTLTTAQKTERDITGNDTSSNPSAQGGKNSDSVVTRNTIAWSSGDATTTNTDRACSYLSWQDGSAFADWAALRPMTELELEKAARGMQLYIAGEYAWGNTTLTQLASISGTENGSETSGTASANANYSSGIAGAVRAGLFAASSTTRTLAGAGYYGNMELSGNLWERTVTIGNSTGRAFTGTHGDGTLTTTSTYEGNATNSDWPGIDGTASRGVTGATGGGNRGGGYGDVAGQLPPSARGGAASTNVTRNSAFGFRCVRTAS